MCVYAKSGLSVIDGGEVLIVESMGMLSSERNWYYWFSLNSVSHSQRSFSTVNLAQDLLNRFSTASVLTEE